MDGDISTWWQSPPLSRYGGVGYGGGEKYGVVWYNISLSLRGRKYNYVDLEINLKQTFQVRPVMLYSTFCKPFSLKVNASYL